MHLIYMSSVSYAVDHEEMCHLYLYFITLAEENHSKKYCNAFNLDHVKCDSRHSQAALKQSCDCRFSRYRSSERTNVGLIRAEEFR